MIDVRLSRTIVPPCFEAGREALRLLTSIYEAVTPKFALSLSDLQALSGGTLAEVGIRGFMFNQNLEFEVAPERFNIGAKRIQSDGDLDVIRQCAMLLHVGVRKAFPNIKFGRSTLTSSGWLAKVPDTNPPSVASILAKVVPQDQLKLLDGEALSYGGNVKVRNEANGYVASLMIDSSLVPGYELYFRISLEVEPHSPIFELPMIAGAAEAILERWFAHLGIPTPGNRGARNASG